MQDPIAKLTEAIPKPTQKRHHPVEVMNLLAQAGAAVLHDTVEDTDTTYAESVAKGSGNNIKPNGSGQFTA